MAESRRNDDPSPVSPTVRFAVFCAWVLIALIIAYPWWFAGAAGLVVLLFVVRAAMRRRRAVLAAAEERAVATSLRADQQDRWMLIGDSRGVYGAEGAKLMSSVAPGLQPADSASAAGTTPRFAAICDTPAGLSRLAAEKLPCPTATTLERLEEFVSTPAFTRMLGDPTDEDNVDADGIMQTANRLMDFHDRLLELAEGFRGVTAATRYAALLRAVNQMMDAPLAGYQSFIDEFAERVAELPKLLLVSEGRRGDIVDAGTIRLHMEIPPQVSREFSRELRKPKFFEWLSSLAE